MQIYSILNYLWNDILFARERKASLMLQCLIVGAGGFLGAVLRYLIGLLPVSPASGFPIKTFAINVLGAFAIGIVAALGARNALDPRLTLFLKVGVCGGFTTFSSFALETNDLLAKGATATAALYVVLSIALGVLAVLAAEKLVG
jgi:CrcB protein